MTEIIYNNTAAPKTSLKKSICLDLDQDVVNGLEKIKAILLIPIDSMISQSLRPFVETILPIADLHEQGKLTVECLPELMKTVNSVGLKLDVAIARLDQSVKKVEKQKKAEVRDKK